MSLSNAPVSALDLESSVMKLFAEWLAKWFDGHAHALGANPTPVTFPSATLRFQQSAQPQPLTGVGISAVWVSASNIKRYWEKGQQVSLDNAAWFFLVRAATDDAACRTTGDRLFALLSNSAGTKELSEKGIHKIAPSNPQLISEGKGSPGTPDLNYITRLVPCKARLRYPILSQGGVIAAPTAPALSIGDPSLTPGALVISWPKPAGSAGRYQIYRTLTDNEWPDHVHDAVQFLPGPGPFELLETVSSAANSITYEDDSVSEDNIYLYYVISIVEGVASAASNAVSAIPAAP